MVDFDPEHYPDFMELSDIEDQLSEVLDTRVDLVTKSSLRKRIGKQILNEAKVYEAFVYGEKHSTQ